jgi:hypothetical protein
MNFEDFLKSVTLPVDCVSAIEKGDRRATTVIDTYFALPDIPGFVYRFIWLTKKEGYAHVGQFLAMLSELEKQWIATGLRLIDEQKDDGFFLTHMSILTRVLMHGEGQVDFNQQELIMAFHRFRKYFTLYYIGELDSFEISILETKKEKPNG